MLRQFSTINDLLDHVNNDKTWSGAESAMLNRYPIRFILFDNFNDFDEFINELPPSVCQQSVSRWLDSGSSADVLITYSQLAEHIKEYIKDTPAHDFIITPFSEIARFYDNETYKEFDSLIKTIRLIESPEGSQQIHQRVYIPLIGMHNKMGKFESDPNIHIWEYKSEIEHKGYNLILTRSTIYGVDGLKEYTVVKDITEWLELWQRKDIKSNIICTSKAIFDNAKNAQPDSAFSYTICNNVYEFLTKGIKISFGDITYKESDTKYWEELATKINASAFDFDNFIKQYFNTYNLNSSDEFLSIWFDHGDVFDRWLLSMYYIKTASTQDYVVRALRVCESLIDSELFSKIATKIFDEQYTDTDIIERRNALKLAAERGIRITETSEQKIKARLRAIATNPELGYHKALKLLTPITLSEKSLIIEWIGRGNISVSDIKIVYPELAGYAGHVAINVESSTNGWINDYFNLYRKAKIADNIIADISDYIKTKNKSALTFQTWYDNFKTVKTLLHNRTDIEVYYWIDGLGVDWIPFVKYVLDKYKHNGVYLNEIMIGTADLPTRTENNREKLQSLCNNELQKIADLDEYAHKSKKYPQYIIDELRIVEEAIKTIATQYNGKKVAIVSDHGLTYLSQKATGLNLAGITADHEGRVATRNSARAVNDTNYKILDDGRTLCALNYNSLTSKVDSGHGAHGGCTPEEVLVPIFIISPQENASNYRCKIIDSNIITNNPVVKFDIKGLSSADSPIIRYNGREYNLNKMNDNLYESERINLVDTCKSVTLIIGKTFQQDFPITMNTGTEEEDLFDF